MRGTVGTRERTQQAHCHDDQELCPREVEEERNRSEHDLLQDHREAHDRSDHHSEEATRHDEDECLVEVKQLDPRFCEAHGPEDADLLRLVEQVRAHAGGEGEEAEDHGDHDDHVEDDVEDELDDLRRLGIIEIVKELH